MPSIINCSGVISATSDKGKILAISFAPKCIIDYKGHPLRYFPLFLEYILCDISVMSSEVSLHIKNFTIRNLLVRRTILAVVRKKLIS